MLFAAGAVRPSRARLLLSAARAWPSPAAAAAAAGRAAAREAWLQQRSLSGSSSNSSSSSGSSSSWRGVEQQLLEQLQQQRGLKLDEVLQAMQKLLQRQHTSFAHPGASSSSSSSSTILPDEFVAFISTAAAAAADQQQRLRLLGDGRLQQLLQRLRGRLVGFSVQQLFRLCIALARLQHCPQEVLTRMLYILKGAPGSAGGPPDGRPLRQLSPRQLAQLPVLLAAATGCCDPAVSRCSSRHSAQQQQQEQQQSKDEMHAFLEVYGQHVVALLLQQQQALNHTANPDAAVAPAAASDTQEAAAAAHFTAEDLCMLLIGSASLGFRHLSLIDLAAGALRLLLALHYGGPTAPEQQQLQQLLLQQGEEMQQQQLMLLPLPSVLLSLATLGASNGSAFLEISYHLTRIAPLLSLSKLTDCLLALASLRTNPSASPSLALLSEVERQLSERAASCSLTDAVKAAWAAVALQLHRGEPRLLLQLLQQFQMLQQQREADWIEDDWGELPMQLRQVSLELCLDPRAQKLRQVLLRERLGELIAFPVSVCGEAAETADATEAKLAEEVEQLLLQGDVLHRLLLTVDARLEQRQQQQQQQQQEQEQQQEERLHAEDADVDRFKRVAASVQLRDFPSLNTYRVSSLIRWPAAAAGAAAEAGAAAAAGGPDIAPAVHEAEKRGGDGVSLTLAVVVDAASFPGFEGPSEVYAQLKHRHLLRAGHALIAVRPHEWRAAADSEAQLQVLVDSLQLPGEE
ncbi:hypothetical protein Efla_001791 [Eimeria flavescens]